MINKRFFEECSCMLNFCLHSRICLYSQHFKIAWIATQFSFRNRSTLKCYHLTNQTTNQTYTHITLQIQSLFWRIDNAFWLYCESCESLKRSTRNHMQISVNLLQIRKLQHRHQTNPNRYKSNLQIKPTESAWIQIPCTSIVNK